MFTIQVYHTVNINTYKIDEKRVNLSKNKTIQYNFYYIEWFCLCS